MSWLTEFLHPGRAYDSARQPIQDALGRSQAYQQPFLDTGMQAGQQLSPALQKLMNPEQLEADWMKGYETSPYAKRLIDQSKRSGMDAASSMGLTGSSAALENIERTAGDISSKDRQQYLQDLMQKYMSGIGLGQNLYGTGAQVGSQMGQREFGAGEDMAQLGIAGRQAGAQRLGDILGTLGQGTMAYFGGGFGKGNYGRGAWMPSYGGYYGS